MKERLLNFTVFFLLFAVITTISSCSKEKTPQNVPDNYTVTVFANQTGNPSASALQAQIVNNTKGYTINTYGSYINNNHPDKPATITVKNNESDTTVFFILDNNTGFLQTAFIEVNGIKQPWVIKHEYIAGKDSAVVISVYDYDWNTNTGTLKFESVFERQNGVSIETPSYAAFKATDWWNVGALAVGVVVAEAAFYGTGVGFLGTAAGAALVGAAGTIVTVAAAAAVIVVSVAVLTSSSASASTLEPGNTPYPTNTVVNNPVTVNNNPYPHLPPSTCNGVGINFSVGINEQGGITVYDVNGGAPPYTYADRFPLAFQSSAYFGSNHPAGTYTITVKDANGCMAAKHVDLVFQPIELGQLYNGGIIFYFLQPGDIGYDANLQHGLLASPIGSSYGREWGCLGTNISGAAGTAIGTGKQNTLDIVNGCAPSQLTTAGYYCYESTTYTYTDWYLPSKNELLLLYQERNRLNYTVLDTWSSSEVNDSLVWSITSSGQFVTKYKNHTAETYPIRSF